jgi:hypothetical protein
LSKERQWIADGGAKAGSLSLQDAHSFRPGNCGFTPGRGWGFILTVTVQEPTMHTASATQCGVGSGRVPNQTYYVP